ARLAGQLRRDVVVDPLRIPPLHRKNRYAMQIDAVMQVVAGGEPGLPGSADDVPLLNSLSDFHVDLAEMTVEREKADPVVEDHRGAVDAQVRREHDRAAVRGFDGIAFRHG